MEAKTSNLVHEEVKINSNLQCMQSALHNISKALKASIFKQKLSKENNFSHHHTI